MLLILFFFLSLCDPKHHDGAHGHENPAHADFKGDAASHETKGSVEAPEAAPEGEAARAGVPAEAPAQQGH